MVLAGLAWVLLMDAFEAAKADLGDRAEQAWLDVRYEDLLNDPNGTVGECSSSSASPTGRLP